MKHPFNLLPTLGHPAYGLGDDKTIRSRVNLEDGLRGREYAGAPDGEVISFPRRKDA